MLFEAPRIRCSSCYLISWKRLLKLRRIPHLVVVLQVFVVEQGMVDPEHDPVKQSTVQRLCHGIPYGASLQTNNKACIIIAEYSQQYVLNVQWLMIGTNDVVNVLNMTIFFLCRHSEAHL